MADLWEDYAAGRSREDELDEVRPMVTPKEAEQIGNVRHQEHKSLRQIGSALAGSSAVKPIMDYVINPIATAFEAYDKTVGSSFRFMLAADPSLKDDVKGSDITGIKSEPFTRQMEEELFDGPWYKAPLAAASIVANRPKAALNFATELAADPLNIALGAGTAVRSATKGVTAAKQAIDRTASVEQAVTAERQTVQANLQAARKEALEAQPVRPEGSAEGAVPEPPVPGIQNTLESVPRDRHFDLAAADPSLAFSETKTVPTNLIDLAHPMDSPEGVASAMKYKDKFKKGEPVERLVLEEKPDGRFVPVSGNGRTAGASLAGVKELHADVFKPKGSVQIPKATPPEVTLTPMTDVKQTVLPGFGRSVRQKEGLPELEGPEAHSIPDPAQQTMIFSKIMDVEDWQKRALLKLDLATHGDKQMTARARVLLEQHLVTPWSIKAGARLEPSAKSGFKPHEFKEQDYIAASAAVEASFTEDFARLAREYQKKPSSAVLEQLMVKMTGAKEVTSALMSDAAKHGAALRAEKTRQRPVVQAMEGMIRDLPPGTTPERMIEMFNSLADKPAQSEFIKGLIGHTKGIKGNLLGIYLNSILSSTAGLSVFVGNFTAGASLLATKLAEKRMAAMFSSDVLPGEAGVQAWSFVKSYLDLASAGYKNRKGLPLTEAEAQVSQEFNERSAKAVARWRGEDPIRNVSGPKLTGSDTVYEWGIDAMTRILNFPSFVIGNGDAVLGFAVKQSAMEAAAYREAMHQAQAAVRVGKELSPKEFSKLVADRRQELMRNPDAKVMSGGKMVPLSEIGEHEADVINMMHDIKGGIGGKIQQATESSLAFRTLVPFFRVMYNSSAEAIYRMPVMSLVSPRNVDDFLAGGERKAMAMARVGMGAMLGMGAASLVGAGVLVPDGPADPAMRRVYRMDQANKPGIKIGDNLIPYEKLGSVGQLVRTVANMAYMLPRIDDEDAARQWSLALAGTLASAFTDVRVAKDLHDLVGALSMRDEKGFLKFIEELPAKMVPYSGLLRQIVQQTEGHITAAEGPLGNIKNTIPGFNKLTYYNEVGEVSEVPDWRSWNGLKKDFGWTPIPNTDPLKKKVYDQLEKDQVHITGPARTQAPHVQLPIDAYMELRRLYGNMSVGGQTLFEALDKLQAMPAFKAGTNGPQGSKQDLISSVTSAYKNAAWAELLSQRENGQLKWKDLIDAVERAERFKAGR